jgi:hypothetical protein
VCQERQLAPLNPQRNDLELHLRWMQDIRRFKPSTVSRMDAGDRHMADRHEQQRRRPETYGRRPSQSMIPRM